MNTLIGLIVMAVGSFGQSSSYVPIRKVKDWAWESFWLSQGIFAWLVFPLLGVLLTLPPGENLLSLYFSHGATSGLVLLFGVLWGMGGLSFGLSMRYLGVAMGQSVALGTCSAFGTLIPALVGGTNLLQGSGLVLLISVSTALAGIAVIGYAGSLRAAQMSEEDRKKAIRDFALTRGLLVALLAGVMSAAFAWGLQAGQVFYTSGASPLFQDLPATFLITLGGFVSNAVYCLYQHRKNKSWGDYRKQSVLLNNWLFCMLAGGLWYSQFFGFSLGRSFFEEGSVMLAFSWSILMTLNILFSNLWGIWLNEWKGVSRRGLLILAAGMLVLLLSLVFPELLKQW